MRRPLILYDDDCGFCNWLVQWLLAWDREQRLATLPIQAPEAEPLLRHLSEDERMASWHLARPEEPLVKQPVQELNGKAALWDLHPWADGLRDADAFDRQVSEMRRLFQ